MNRLERDYAQPECGRFFRTLGWSFKNPDAAPCNYDKGRPDNFIALRATPHPKFLVCEVKADAARFEFKSLSEDQRKWMNNWQKDHGCYAWFWLMLGDQAIDAKSPFARRTWLMPFNDILHVEAMFAERDIMSLPMNEEAAQSRIWTRDNRMWATQILKTYEMVYNRRNVELPETHVFKEVFDVEYALRGSRDAEISA